MNETVSNKKDASSLICFIQCPSVLFVKDLTKIFWELPRSF